MRILVIYQDWDGTMFGPEERFFHWFDEKDGAYGPEHEYHVISLARREGRKRLKKNVKVTFLESSPRRQFFTLLRLRRAIEEEIERWKPDAIYSPFIYLLSCVPRAWKGTTAGLLREQTAQMVKAKGGMRSIMAPLFTMLDRRAFRRINLLFYNGESLTRYARENGYEGLSVYSPRQVTDADRYGHADPAIIIKRYRLDGMKTILMVCRLTPEKNPVMGIKAMKHLPKDYHLVIVGEGEEKGRLLKVAKEEGVDGRIVFTGYVAHKDIWSYYKAAMVLWLVSKTDFEGMPNVVLEAMHAKVPSIVTDLSAMRNIVSDGKDGIVLEGFSPEELARRTVALATDEDLRARIIAGGNAKVRKIEGERVRVIDVLERGVPARKNMDRAGIKREKDPREG